mgnify:CR=1 FL=1|jgi:spore coat polysaccharide biosynthesis protein SpsF
MVSVLIAARMGSSRFPGKTLEDLCGKPMIEQMLDRINESKLIQQVILATTINPEDDALEEWANKMGILCYRGSSNDVLGRLKGAVDKFNLDTIVELLGDNPLVHSDIIDASIEKYKKGNFDYLATITDEYKLAKKSLKRFPIGVRVQVFSAKTIVKCENLAKSELYREHATSFIADNPQIFNTGFLEAAGKFSQCNRPKLTFAVNHRDNLDMIRVIYENCYENNTNFSLDSAIEVLDLNPDLFSLMGDQGTN